MADGPTWRPKPTALLCGTGCPALHWNLELELGDIISLDCGLVGSMINRVKCDVDDALLHAGPNVMEFMEQNNTQLVSSPTNLTVRIRFLRLFCFYHLRIAASVCFSWLRVILHNFYAV